MLFFNREFQFCGTIKDIIEDKFKLDEFQFSGVYIFVLSDKFGEVSFCGENHSGWFKEKNPTISVEKLEENRVKGANVLYIGETERTIKKRVMEHIRFWNSKPVGAYGGRAVAQINNYVNLEIWCLKTETPKKTKQDLLLEFKKEFKKSPFANLK